MSKKDFFAKQTQGSEVKTEIVRKYFGVWAGVMVNQAKRHGYTKIGYADLFAGKGRYLDGSKSTPILILESAIRDKAVREMLVSIFNDANPKNAQALKDEIANITDIELLAHQPKVISGVVDDSLAEKFESISTIPTLYFLDPWGYKNISLRLIKAVLKPAGCDCIFFFNYNRVNAALSNPEMKSNMDSFFGKERADKLRNVLAGQSPKQREDSIISELKSALRDYGGKYSIEYFFKDQSGSRTSHFLILTSKVPLAERKMKEIMARESSTDEYGFASFGFSPKSPLVAQGSLFAQDPRQELCDLLIAEFAGRTITIDELYKLHSIGRRFTLRNYKDAINKLDSDGLVETDPPAEARVRAGKVTLSDRVVVKFNPERRKHGN